MKVNKSSGGGAWLDKKAVRNGDDIKIITEAQMMPSNQPDGKDQLVCKVRVRGLQGDHNVAINAPSKNALIEAFGDDTSDWVDKVLTAHIEKTMVAGKRGLALYLIPEGFEVTEDDENYVKVLPIGSNAAAKAPKVEDEEDGRDAEPNPDDIPF